MANQSPSIGNVLLSFNGRIGLAKFWFYTVVLLVVYIALIVLFMSAYGDRGLLYGFIIGFLVTAWPGLAISVKRCHDCGHSGSLLLTGLIPFSEVWGPDILLKRGDVGENKYGPDPLEDQ